MKTPSKRSAKKSKKPAAGKAGRVLRSVRKPSGPVDQLAVLRQRHRAEEGALLKETFTEAEWSLAETARRLGCRVTTLQRAAGRHPELKAERAKWHVTRWGSERAA